MNSDSAHVRARVRVGTAGWTIPLRYSAALPGPGSHLERYARRLAGVEIDSSFYKPHRAATYARWTACVPSNFSFAVKMPREVTHVLRLQDTGPALERFLGEVASLAPKLGPVLIQLPPSLESRAGPTAARSTSARARTIGPMPAG